MVQTGNIFGCFMKIGFDPSLREDEFMKLAEIFRPYLWGDKGISITLKKLHHENYGKDLILVLFQFMVKPKLIELEKLRDIESYRKKERSIGINIIITDDNFFNKSEKARYKFFSNRF